MNEPKKQINNLGEVSIYIRARREELTQQWEKTKETSILSRMHELQKLYNLINSKDS